MYKRQLSISHNKLGEVLVAQGDFLRALVAFQAGLAIAEKLACLDPSNAEWQRDLSLSQDKIGDVLVAQNDLPGALASFRKCLNIRKNLTARDPENARWQLDEALCCAKLGVFVELGKSERLAYLQRGQRIFLALRDAHRLLLNQDFTSWFETAVKALGEEVTER